ncbi:MAG: hypothetical protein GY772_08145 [bacterium]|nr:hypothetical protein [bacterium]
MTGATGPGKTTPPTSGVTFNTARLHHHRNPRHPTPTTTPTNTTTDLRPAAAAVPRCNARGW